jgi:hypothetical protein
MCNGNKNRNSEYFDYGPEDKEMGHFSYVNKYIQIAVRTRKSHWVILGQITVVPMDMSLGGCNLTVD